MMNKEQKKNYITEMKNLNLKIVKQLWSLTIKA